MGLPLNPLSRPVPAEAAIQLARHLSQINTRAGYNFDFEGKVNLNPKDRQNSSIARTKKVVANVGWDLDRCLDENDSSFTTGITSYRSTCFLNCFLWESENLQEARGNLISDLHKYLFSDEHWQLYNENRESVVRETWIGASNINLTFEEKPIIRVDVELAIYWAAVRNNLYWPQ